MFIPYQNTQQRGMEIKMNINSNTNVSFKAKFALSNVAGYSYDEWKTALKESPKKTQSVVDFIAYMNTDEAKDILNKLPKEDTVELHIIDEDEEGIKIKPYLFYRSKDMMSETRDEMERKHLEGTWANPSQLERKFKSWSNKIINFLSK